MGTDLRGDSNAFCVLGGALFDRFSGGGVLGASDEELFSKLSCVFGEAPAFSANDTKAGVADLFTCDGAGVGDKDEDTMLAQLADGEFVSRADAVLGAGILSGADPKNFKGMRKAGADFFYNQQKQFKRIYDITNASKQN